MNSTALSLTAVSIVFAVWMSFLSKRAVAGRLGRTGPGIRIPAAKVCQHTWLAAQKAAAPRYLKLAGVLVVLGAVTVVLDLAGVEPTAVIVVWFIAAIGAQVTLLAGAGRDAAIAAAAVRCEHQAAPKMQRASSGRSGPRPTSRTNARRGKSKNSRRAPGGPR